MKKVAKGLLYDSSTARLIHTSPAQKRTDDTGVYWYREELYQTPNKRFFTIKHVYNKEECGEEDREISHLYTATENDAISWCEIYDVPTELVLELFQVREA